MASIVTTGEILVEIMASEIGQGFLEPGTWQGPYPSGAPAILADQAARCGSTVAMLACVGDDDFGQLNTNRLASAGVDVSGIRTVPVTTGSAFVTYHADGSRDFIFNIANSASAELKPEHIDANLLDGCQWFHVMGSSLFNQSVSEAIVLAVSLARQAGARVSIDPNVRKELIDRPGVADTIASLVRQADLLLLSEDDLAHLCPDTSEADAVKSLLDGQATLVVLKRGARGSAAFERRQPGIEQPAFQVEEVDPTGAGDCFGGTFLSCYTQGKPLPECLRYAAAAGAMAVGHKGPMEGNSSLREIEAFLQTT